MDELDISWFKNHEIIEKKYDNFYKVNLSNLNIKFLYVKNDELVYVKNLKYNLNNNEVLIIESSLIRDFFEDKYTIKESNVFYNTYITNH